MQLTTKISQGKSKSSCVKKMVLGIAALAAASQTVHAQTEAQRIADLERKLQNALTIIDKLSDKVESLDGNGKNTDTFKNADSTVTTPIELNKIATLKRYNSK